MDFLQNLMARHQTELSQPQTAVSQSGLPSASNLSSASKIVQPRQKLRFEGASESLMQEADVYKEGFSDQHMSQTDSTYHHSQTNPDFTEFDIGSAIHREMPGEKQNTRPQHSAGISPDTLFGMLNVPQNNQQDHTIANESDYKNSNAQVAIDSIGKILEGTDRLPSTSRVQKEANVVHPASQSDSKLDSQLDSQLNSQLDFQSNKPQGWQPDAVHSSAEMMQNKWAAHPASSSVSLSNTGALHTPDWLNQIQADLQDRWQALSQKAQAEPVINVTIGRVEVRAVQADSAPVRKKSTLPSGVMTLDSYLKQRNSKGGV